MLELGHQAVGRGRPPLRLLRRHSANFDVQEVKPRSEERRVMEDVSCSVEKHKGLVGGVHVGVGRLEDGSGSVCQTLQGRLLLVRAEESARASNLPLSL